MAEQKSSYRLVETNFDSRFFGEGLGGEDKALAIHYLENSIGLTIHNELPKSQQTGSMKYDYKSGNVIYLNAKKAKTFAKYVIKALVSLENGEDIKSHAIPSATNLIEVCDASKFDLDNGVAIVIYNNMAEDKTSDTYAVFKFRSDDLITDYDAKTGTYGKTSANSDIEYFAEILKEFAKASSMATSHFVRKNIDWNIRTVMSRQLECMNALGIKPETPYSSRVNWNNNSNNTGTTQSVMSTNDLLNELENLGE